MTTKKTQTDKPRRYHAEFRLTTSWTNRDENPDKRRYHANYESKFKPGTDEHTIDFWEEVLNCFGPLKTPYEEKIRLYRKSDGETAPLNPYDDVTLDSCEAAFDEQEKIQRLHDAEKAAEEAEEKAETEVEGEPAENEQVEIADSGDSDGGPLPDENGGEKDETGEEPAGDTVDAGCDTVREGEKTVDDDADPDCDGDSVSDIDSDDEPSDAADDDTEKTKDDTAENDE